MHQPQEPDRRHASRYAVELPIEIKTGEPFVMGRTRDLNQDGIAVSLPMPADSLSTGDRVGFALLLQHLTPEGPARLEGTAVVLRVEPNGHELVLALKPEWLMTTPVMTADAIARAASGDDL